MPSGLHLRRMTIPACAVVLAIFGATRLSQARTRTRASAGALSKTQGRMPALTVSSKFAKFLPKGAVLRFSAATHMTAGGETVLAYEDDIDPGMPFSDAHLLVIRDKRVVAEFVFANDASGIAGAVAFPLGNRLSAVAWACRLGADGSGVEFQVFAWQKGAYTRILDKEASQGRMEIWKGRPLRIDVWSSTRSLDESNPNLSCVWCLHFYKIEQYRWTGNGFKLVGERSTHKALNPEQVTDTPFVIQPPRAAGRN